MGLFHKNKTSTTPPPPAAEVGSQPQHQEPIHDNNGVPYQNTGNSTMFTPPQSMSPAPQYTPNSGLPNAHGISPSPQPGANGGAYGEKGTGGVYPHDPNTQQQQVYNQDPSYNASQGQYNTAAPPNSHQDFHAQDKNAQYQQGQQGQYFPPGQHQQQNFGGRNNYQVAIPLRSLQTGPEPVDCPVCGVRDITRTEYTSGGTTHLSAFLCCIVLCLGCIPYLATWFKDCEHYCGNCGALLAVWHRSGRTEVFGKGRK